MWFLLFFAAIYIIAYANYIKFVKEVSDYSKTVYGEHVK